MSFQDLLRELREAYPEQSWRRDIELLEWAEDRLEQLAGVDDLTPGERKRIALLPYIEAFLDLIHA